jgi:Tfp pilus assembly protein PilX
MTSTMETSTRRERSVIYIVSIVLLVVMLIIGLVTFASARESQRAAELADELTAALEAEGARVPSQDAIIGVFGDDGGAVCAADPGDGLVAATLFAQLTNGAAGPGMRPVIADSRVVQGSRLVIETYCPDKLADFEQAVADLDLNDEVAG